MRTLKLRPQLSFFIRPFRVRDNLDLVHFCYYRPSHRGVEFVSQVTACDSGATAAESVSISVGSYHLFF
jgi:hypothetical protein